MNLITNYKKGIHPDCGKKIKIHKDIIITPFYTEEFCKELIKICNDYDNLFENIIKYETVFQTEITNKSPWQTLFFSKISYYLFKLFCQHYDTYISPVITKHFIDTVINGWFSPMIIKYDKPGQDVALHTDTSHITLNVKLNNDFKGCELEFPRQKWSNKDIPVGYCFIWPSVVTHPHFAKPLIDGKKYVISSWTHPSNWNPDFLGGSIFRDALYK